MVQMLFVRLVVVWMMVWMVDTSDCRVALAAEKGSFSIYLEQM